MNTYLALKYLHVTCVVLSGCGFLLRGFWMLRASPRLDQRWVRLLRDSVDTLLLGSAITMAVMTGQFPFVQDWLTAKLFALLAYILCGMMAMKYGRTRRIRIMFFVLAVLCFACLVSIALTRQVVWW